MTEPRDLEILEQLLPLIPETIDVQNEIHYIFENKKFTQIRSIKSLKRLELGQEAIYVQLRQMLSKLIRYKEHQLREEFDNFLKSLKFKYKKLDVLHYISDLHDEFKLVPKLEFKEGQVTIIQIWANWCGMSIIEMQELKQTISSNEQWVDKVQFIGISLDSDAEHWKQRLLDENLKDFGEHYKFPAGWNKYEPALMSLNFKGIPFIVILDNFNRIQYRGHPQDINVENKVNELILITEQINEVSEERIQQREADSEISLELDVRQFQQLRIILEEVLSNNMDKYDLSGGEFKVEMIEQNKITHDDKTMNFTPTQRSQIKISFEINIELKEKTIGLLTQITNVIPKTSIVLVKSVYKDSQQDLRQSLKDMFMQHQIDIIYKEVKVKCYNYDQSMDGFDCEEYEISGAEVNKDSQLPHNIGQFQEAMQQIEPVLKNLNNLEMEEYAFKLLFEIKQSFQYCVGDKFEGIDNFEDSHGKSMDSRIIGNKQYVLLVMYLSKKDIGFSECIKRVVEIVCRNQWNYYNKKVKIIALCCDVDTNKNVEFISFDVLMNIEFCFPVQSGVSTELYPNFELPYYIVVDQNSIIRAIGSEVNLEQILTTLLQEKPLLNRLSTFDSKIIDNYKSQALQEYLGSNEYKNILNQLGDEYLFKLSIQLTEEVQQNKAPVCHLPEIEYTIRENKLPVIKPIMNAITSIIPKQQLIINENLLKTFDVPFPGNQCHLCKKPLNKDMQQYYQPFDKYFLCCECAEHDDKSKVGLARYKCSDTLIFINAPLADLSVLKEIDEHKIGTNLKISADDPGSQHHDMICNGCGKGSVGPRYIAANCLPGALREDGHVDFCSDCFKQLRNKESEVAKKIIERNKHEGYNLSANYLFVRILFSNGYYDF